MSVLENLLKKQEQLDARIQAFKVKEAAQKTKNENRKKMLAGAYILEKHQREGTYGEFVSQMGQSLSNKKDRAAFGLPEKVLDPADLA